MAQPEGILILPSRSILRFLSENEKRKGARLCAKITSAKMNAFAHFFAIIAHERALVKSRGALFADFRFFEKFAEKGLTNGDDGCIMRLVKGNGVFERRAQRRDFLY